MALFNNAPYPNAARVFINWFLSREGQMVYQKIETDVDSLRIDIPKDNLDPRTRRIKGAKYMILAGPGFNDMDPINQALDVDILVAATNAKEPTITGEFVRKGMHVMGVQNELSDQALAKADFIAAHSSKRYLIYMGGSGKGQYGQLSPHHPREVEHEKLPLPEDIIAGKVKGRTRGDQITMFHSGSGMGLQFAAVGARVLQLARERGLGKEIPRSGSPKLSTHKNVVRYARCDLRSSETRRFVGLVMSLGRSSERSSEMDHGWSM